MHISAVMSKAKTRCDQRSNNQKHVNRFSYIKDLPRGSPNHVLSRHCGRACFTTRRARATASARVHLTMCFRAAAGATASERAMVRVSARALDKASRAARGFAFHYFSAISSETLYHVVTPTAVSLYRPDDTGGAAHSCAAGHTTCDK